MAATIEDAWDAAWFRRSIDFRTPGGAWQAGLKVGGISKNMACSLDNTRTHLPLSNHLRQESGLQPRHDADSPTSTRRQEGSTVDWTEEPAQDEKEVFDQLCGMLRDIYFQRRHTLLESYTPVKDHLRQEYGLQPRQSLRRCGHGCDSWKKILSRRPKRSMRKHLPSC